jgi:glucose-1-phosphate cytidylyltransferase
MRVVILAGGYGTRLQEETRTRPKPMVEIGGRPLLWHVMDIYSRWGFKEFVVALGYKGEVIKQYFLTYHHLRHDLTVTLSNPNVAVDPAGAGEDWTVHLIDTGLHTGTGGRLKRLASRLRDGTFMMTYGDGVANVNIAELLALHRSHGKLATLTAVRPPPRFGCLRLDGSRVTAFHEKPAAEEGWINGGFFILEPEVLDYVVEDSTVFERDPLERLAADGQLVAYRHHGFWQCMDTIKDMQFLESVLGHAEAPWHTKPPQSLALVR